ncbi:MAG TPA: DNA polymerase IV [Alphaproteobacteria bacterium]|nr:DNA polymerase IV [Alphaproteobacteria bacterium]
MAAGLCRDCLFWAADAEAVARCPSCGSARIIAHPELGDLTLAHIDCDAFYASVEKRDNPELRDLPVIVGGRKRGVAMTACYVARKYGVHSAMPMFKALELCPQAVVIRPDMENYARVSRQVREILSTATPLVEPVSLDEAYLDLSGTVELHARPAAATLADLARRIEREIGITVSIGLSCNKFLAKLASEIDKPRGFGVIGAREARGYLAGRPVRIIPGVGAKMAARLAADGITRIADLQSLGSDRLGQRYGAFGRRLAQVAMGIDDRKVVPDREAKGISAETTFERDLSTAAELQPELWRLCERVSERLKKAELAGATVVLKLKTHDFRILTRRKGLGRPTQYADVLYHAAAELLAPETGRHRYRLIGVGAADLVELDAIEPELFGVVSAPRARVEQVLDEVRARFGRDSIGKGRGLRPPPSRR